MLVLHPMLPRALDNNLEAKIFGLDQTSGCFGCHHFVCQVCRVRQCWFLRRRYVGNYCGFVHYACVWAFQGCFDDGFDGVRLVFDGGDEFWM